MFKRIFKGAAGARPADFEDSDHDGSGPDTPLPVAPRRELVRAALRDAMRKNGIPSDWIGCRVLAVNRDQKIGLHLQFVVRQGDQQLLGYIHQFQEAFWREVDQRDAFARQWILSIAWQFDGKIAAGSMPAKHSPAPVGASTVAQAHDLTLPLGDGMLLLEEDAVDLEDDLQALYAIRDAAMGDSVRTSEAAALDSDRTPLA